MIDERKARRVIDFIQCLKHTKGEFHGKPFKLLPWQEKIIRDVFGTVREDDPTMRQYTTAYIEIPKKQGKSELGAAIALNMLANDGEWKAEVYSCASDRQQAAIVFDVAVDMVRQSPALMKRIKIIPSMKRMVYQPTGSIYQVLSREVATKHGLNVSACIFDELHTQPTAAAMVMNGARRVSDSCAGIRCAWNASSAGGSPRRRWSTTSFRIAETRSCSGMSETGRRCARLAMTAKPEVDCSQRRDRLDGVA